MKRVCAWCGLVMEEGKPGCEDVTHGMCQKCVEIWRKDAQATVDKYRRRKAS